MHWGKTPQDSVGEKVSYGDTVKKVGRDTYPYLFVGLDVVGARSGQ